MAVSLFGRFPGILPVACVVAYRKTETLGHRLTRTKRRKFPAQIQQNRECQQEPRVDEYA